MGKQKILVVKHQTFRDITNEEVLETLKIDENMINIEWIDVKYEIVPMEQIENLDSIEARSYQRQICETRIKPLLEQNPEAELYYFGATTIPLAVHLGYCVGSWLSVKVFIVNRETGKWTWAQPENNEGLSTTHTFPSQLIEASTEVLYKVEASYPMQPEELKEAIGGHFQTVALSLNDKDKNVFKSSVQLEKFGYEFSQGLDAIATNIPNADKIHLIVTAPVGVAFYLGTQFNPNMTKPVSLYQYNTNKIPRYEEIFVMQEFGTPSMSITEDDEKFIKLIRQRLKKELEERIAVFANSKKEELEKNTICVPSWIDLILPKANYESLKVGYWKYLPNIGTTILVNTTLLEETNEADDRDGFYIDDNGGWQVSDRFIFNIFQRIGKDEERVIRALRMFILHEAFHINQNLTNRTADGIGRLPRILEDADYVADVWTFLHEYVISKQYYSKDVQDEKVFFKDLFNLSIETMWSFAELAPNNNEMQIRAMNRFLIWYWAFNLVDDRRCTSILDIVNRLGIKPILEIRGLDIKARTQRTIYKLSNFKLADLEIGYLSPDQKIHRHASAAGLNLGELVDGFRQRHSSMVANQVKTLYHIISPSLNIF